MQRFVSYSEVSIHCWWVMCGLLVQCCLMSKQLSDVIIILNNKNVLCMSLIFFNKHINKKVNKYLV